jgi:Ca2+-binding RTX toxin-like protein
VVRQGRSIAVVVAFLIGCAVVLMAGASGVQAQDSKKVQSRCEGTRTITPKYDVPLVTNDLPSCPKGGLLLGTDKKDKLGGQEGDDKIRGFGGPDYITGGSGDDVIYGGPGDDSILEVDNGEDVVYGGNGNDHLAIDDGHRDKLYCGEGNDHFQADPNDYVDSSCETASVEPQAASGSVSADPCNVAPGCGHDDLSLTSSASASPSSVPQVLADGGGPSILLPAAALLLGSGILIYVILRRR